MSALSQELDRYLAVRRSLGYDLRTSERVLRRFVDFAELERAEFVTTDLFQRWRDAFGHAHRDTWAGRLGMVRLFAQWLYGIDPRHEVPPKALIPCRYSRKRPYIYSSEQLRSLIDAAAELPSANGIRGLTYANLFGLIAVTGMRVSEAVALDVCDVDLGVGVLRIRQGKLGKERLLPLSESVRAQLAAYARERDRLLGASPECFFVSDRGTRPTDCAARYNFALVCQSSGLRPAQRFHKHGRGPRIHDLRHTFAVNTLLGWYRQEGNPVSEMIRLTTYLGHSKPAHSYWYLQAVPELLELASRRASESLAWEAE